MFLVSHDDTTDDVQAFAQDAAHIYGPAYDLGILDYAVRVDVPECFVLDGSQAAKATVDECLEALRPVGF
jgi:hypothetical protein